MGVWSQLGRGKKENKRQAAMAVAPKRNKGK